MMLRKKSVILCTVVFAVVALFNFSIADTITPCNAPFNCVYLQGYNVSVEDIIVQPDFVQFIYKVERTSAATLEFIFANYVIPSCIVLGDCHDNETGNSSGKTCDNVQVFVDGVASNYDLFLGTEGEPETGLGKDDLSNNVLRVVIGAVSGEKTFSIKFLTDVLIGETTVQAFVQGDQKESGLLKGGACPTTVQGPVTPTSFGTTSDDGTVFTLQTDRATNVISATADGEPANVSSEDEVLFCREVGEGEGNVSLDDREWFCEIGFSATDGSAGKSGEGSTCWYFWNKNWYSYGC